MFSPNSSQKNESNIEPLKLGVSTAGADVILTDLRGQLHHCAQSAEGNESVVRQSGGSVTIMELDWTEPLTDEVLRALPVDVILCSDITFHVVMEHTTAEWINTLEQLYAQHTIVIHMYAPRGSGEAGVMECAKEVFQVEKIDDSFLDYEAGNFEYSKKFGPYALHILIPKN